MRKEDITPEVIRLAKDIYDAGVRFEPFYTSQIVFNRNTKETGMILGKVDQWQYAIFHKGYETIEYKTQIIPIPDFLDCVRWLRKQGAWDWIVIPGLDEILCFNATSGEDREKPEIEAKKDNLLEAILECVLSVARWENDER